jgi:hypothetical protein
MTKAEKQAKEKLRKLHAAQEKAFLLDLREVLVKHNAKIVAKSYGHAYCSSSVEIEVWIDKNQFAVGDEIVMDVGRTDDTIELTPESLE